MGESYFDMSSSKPQFVRQGAGRTQQGKPQPEHTGKPKLEPSCAAVFRDELKNLLPHDEEAQWLSKQTFLLKRSGSSAQLAYPECTFTQQREAAVRASVRKAWVSVGAVLGAGAAGMFWIAEKKKAA